MERYLKATYDAFNQTNEGQIQTGLVSVDEEGRPVKRMDRESVITHLQIIHIWAEFARENDLQFFTAKHLEDIAKWADDALQLLKEQEPVEAELEGGGYSWWYVCGDCHGAIDNKDSYCRHCGRKVKQ